ncbi:T9SS type A sorting domain-containing protein [Psychroserpens sp. XS_ASV72]|uniref:T9SS type A sorting domain-containing protein n=1 Tax=Psychroserpens sp. XS_ASV72 TaxID=3241293 RepID=UPI0035165E5C
MKRILLLLLMLSSTIIMAQTTWTGLGANTNWNNLDNWDTNMIPTASDDVIIPTGFTVTLNVQGNTNSFELQGNSVLEMANNLAFAADSNFGPNTTVNWSAGIIFGPDFTLTNQGEIILTGNASKFISAGTTVINEGTITIASAGDLFITGNTASLNNLANGVIDMQFDGGDITWSSSPGVLNNFGLIKKTTSSGEAQIVAALNNNDGVIQVEDGTLSFQSAAKTFNSGTYNVFSGATLDWDTASTISGNLTGTLDGSMNWNNNVTIAAGDTASTNFPQNFNWNSGIITGGGTLNNLGKMTLAGNANKTVNAETTINNSGTIEIVSAGDLLIVGVTTVLNNLASGIIDFQADGGNITWASAPGVLNNEGLIKKTNSTGEAQIINTLNNINGTIQVESGTLSFQSAAKNFIDGTYNVFSGAILDWDTSATISGNLNGTLDGEMNWNSNISVAENDTASLNFAQNFNWSVGNISGDGILNNNGTMELVSNASKFVTGTITFNNNGTILIVSSGDLLLSSADVTLNNPMGGVIDLQVAGGNITWSSASGTINNSGVIKRTNSTGEAQIITILNNNDGTIQVESGILSFQSSPKNFTDGIYNVFEDAILDWDVASTISGNLTGTLLGTMNWNSNINVLAGDTAEVNFADNFNWNSGIVSGDGTLVNSGVLSLDSNASKFITGATTLNNQGELRIVSPGDLLLSSATVTLNNEIGALIDFRADGGNITWSSAPGVLNNFGLIRRSETLGIAQIVTDFNNSGTIEVASGELEVADSRPFVNLESGVVTGTGVFDVPAPSNYTNNGTFAPGSSPGTLTVQGTYTSTTLSELEIEINGLIPDTEHDVLAIIGNNNVFEGSVNVIMGFEGTIGDAFTIATTSGTIASGNLESPIENVDFDGKRYTFEVSYPDNNKVVLTITDKLDILPPNVITQNITVQLDASGNASILPSEIDNGTTDNCTPDNELQFVLDVDSFTCADLGDNTVNLTVTDNDGNSASAPATVIVEDVISPTAATQDITVQLDDSGSVSILASEIDNGSSDNCSIVDLSLDKTSFTCADLGENTVILTVTDQSGNSASASATVTVEDVISPTVLTQDITIQLDGSGTASITTMQIDNGSSDNCMVASLSLDITDFSCSDLGDNTVELTVTDQSGNGSSGFATVTVEDVTSPMVSTQDISVQLDASGNASIIPNDVNNGSSDNCSIASLSLDVTDFTCADLGNKTVTLTVTDQSGNSASETATVTIVDDIDPTIDCPADYTVETVGDFILPDYVTEGDVTVSDNCGFTVEQTPVAGTNLSDGEYDIIFVVTDSFGNTATCMFQLKVEDTTLGINNFEINERDVLLFPNPAHNVLNVKNNSGIDLQRLDIYDVTGKLVDSLDLKSVNDKIEIPVGHYANGVYFLKLNTNSNTVIKRFIKQ